MKPTATVYLTDEAGSQTSRSVSFTEDTERENELLNLYPDARRQTFVGLGGAMTEAAALQYAQADDAVKQDILKLLYHPSEGLGYSVVRLPIHSCDFSAGSYTYLKEGDESLQSFSIERDLKSIVPFAQASQAYARKHGSDIDFLASPWSPPAFMKDNGDMRFGGRLLPQYRKAWADYFVAYLDAYRERGVSVCAVTVQNEAKAAQTWESCQYTAREEAAFAADYLRPALDAAGYGNVKIFLWDHNKERLYERARDSFAAADAADGLAFHWYSGDHFEALELVHQAFPDKALFLSEFCCGASRGGLEGKRPAWPAVALYAHELIGDFSRYVVGATDWNMLLDEQGGPFHDRERGCTSVLTLLSNGALRKEAQYMAMAHFGRYVRKGAVCIGSSAWSPDLQHVAFQNPDQSIAVVMLNETAQTLPVCLRLGNSVGELELPPRTLATAVLSV